jgi:hypothetical protein
MRPWLVLLLCLAAPIPAAAESVERVEPETAVRAALAELQPQFRRCYERSLKRRAAEGQVVLSLGVSRSGKWRHIRLKSASRGHAAVGRCIASRLFEAPLPRLTASARLEVPIRLRPQEP